MHGPLPKKLKNVARNGGMCAWYSEVVGGGGSVTWMLCVIQVCNVYM